MFVSAPGFRAPESELHTQVADPSDRSPGAALAAGVPSGLIMTLEQPDPHFIGELTPEVEERPLLFFSLCFAEGNEQRFQATGTAEALRTRALVAHLLCARVILRREEP